MSEQAWLNDDQPLNTRIAELNASLSEVYPPPQTNHHLVVFLYQ